MEREEHARLVAREEIVAAQRAGYPQWEAPGCEFVGCPLVPGYLVLYDVPARQQGVDIRVGSLPGRKGHQLIRGRGHMPGRQSGGHESKSEHEQENADGYVEGESRNVKRE